jgi:zinc and cadmium transporter
MPGSISIGQLIAVYCIFIVISSMLGGFLPSLLKLSHIGMQLVMSLVSGFMLGIAMLHLIPFAVDYLPIHKVCYAMLAGVLVMFFLLRIFHVHHHGDLGDEHSHTCEHVHEHSEEKQNALSWFGLFFGLAVHTLLDGIALSSMVMAEHSHQAGIFWPGFGMFLAVLLHKPLDALSITSLMQVGGWHARRQLIVNCIFALTCPLGALLFWFGFSQLMGGEGEELLGYTLGFSAGFFLCIALGDLLPEVQFHSHDRVKLSFCLVLGVFFSFVIESTHSHVESKLQNDRSRDGSTIRSVEPLVDSNRGAKPDTSIDHVDLDQ